MANLANQAPTGHLNSRTRKAISRERIRRLKDDANSPQSSGIRQWKHAADLARSWSRSHSHYQDQLDVCVVEHMSLVDSFDGRSARMGRDGGMRQHIEDEDLPIINPGIDGRLKDEGRVQSAK
jgi:hypothetical protein